MDGFSLASPKNLMEETKAPMFRLLYIQSNGSTKTLQGTEFVQPPPEGVLCWIDIEKPDTYQLQLLADRFGFHPLTIEDCAHFDQLPKIEDYGDYIFLVTHGIELHQEPNAHLHTVELHTFLGDLYLVTVHDKALPALDRIWERLLHDTSAAQRGVDFIRYLIADAIVDDCLPLMDQFANDVEDVEAKLLASPPGRDVLEEILRIKRLHVALRKVLTPQRNTIGTLSRIGNKYIDDKIALYFRDVHDHLLRLTESLEANRELLEGVLSAYHWAVTQRTNEIVKRLTLLSAIFLPLTFITGFFGQNFEGLPFESRLLMLVMLISCIIVPAGMLWFFLRSKWF